MTSNGTLADVDALEAEVKRAMIVQAREPILLIHRSKLMRPSLNEIGHVTDASLVLAHGVQPTDVGRFQNFGIPVRLLTEPS